MDTKATKQEADQTFNTLTEMLSSIKSEDFNIVPFAGSWTPGQLAQHVILSAGGFVELLNGPVTDTIRDPEENVPGLKAAFLDFNTKMESPEFIVPEEKDYDKLELLKTLTNINDNFSKAIEKLDITKTCTGFELPNSGYIIRAEAITFTIVHTQRQIHQLKKMINCMLGTGSFELIKE